MKNIQSLNYKFLFFAFFLLPCILFAQDKISFKWIINMDTYCTGAFKLENNNSESFIINWGDGVTETVEGGASKYSHFYGYENHEKEYEVNITACNATGKFISFVVESYQISTIIFFGCTALEKVDCRNNKIENLDLTDCILLKNLNCSNNRISNLNTSNWLALETLQCSYNKISSLDLSNCTALTNLFCSNNLLQLPDLYAAHLLIEEPSNKLLGTQNPMAKWAHPNTELFADQSVYNGVFTNYTVETGGNPAPVNSYTVTAGKLIFHELGNYKVTMTNDAIISHPSFPAKIIVEIIVLDPYNDASLSNLAVSEGELTPVFISNVFDYTVNVPHNIAEITITATPSNEKATVNGDGVKQLAVGNNLFTILVTAEDGTTKQTYTVRVTRGEVGISSASLTNLQVYPNPTTGELRMENGELRINSVEVFDIYGRKVSSNHPINTSSNHLINISQLPAGIYFVKIATEQGEIVKKVIKK